MKDMEKVFEQIGKEIAEMKKSVTARDVVNRTEELLKENGVVVNVTTCTFDGATEMSIGLDFTEHDKVFEDKIAKLEKQIESYESERKELRTRCCMDSAREKFDNHSYGGFVIYTKNFTSECERRLYDENQELKQRISELESKETETCEKEPIPDDCRPSIEWYENRHQSDCIEINRLNTTIDVLIHKIEYLRHFAGLE